MPDGTLPHPSAPTAKNSRPPEVEPRPVKTGPPGPAQFDDRTQRTTPVPEDLDESTPDLHESNPRRARTGGRSRGQRRARHRGRPFATRLAVSAPLLTAGMVVAALAVSNIALAAPAGAATWHDPFGRISSVTRSGGTAKILGFARDYDSALPVKVTISIDGVPNQRVMADRIRAVNGHHTAFSTVIHLSSGAHRVCADAENRGPGANTHLGCIHVPATWESKNKAIAKLAAHYVGARYVHGGTSPSTGFDCSGFVHYVYRKAARIKTIPIAQAERDHAHKVSKSHARAGDLVFFYSGSHVYHVGIYAGGNRMWAAATPSEGVRYQSIYSSDVSFGSYTH